MTSSHMAALAPTFLREEKYLTTDFSKYLTNISRYLTNMSRYLTTDTWCSSKTSSLLWSLGVRPFRCVCTVLRSFLFSHKCILQITLLHILVKLWCLEWPNDQSCQSNFIISRTDTKWRTIEEYREEKESVLPQILCQLFHQCGAVLLLLAK